MILFPKWTNHLKIGAGVLFAIAPVYLVALIWYGASPRTTDVGYAPAQPIDYSHKVHAGDLRIDCRYCHGPVERGAPATIPPTDTCMNCHLSVASDTEATVPLRESYETGLPIPWIRVHDLPDYVYFNHAAHVRRGVGCASCHGPVDQMDVATQVQTLSMGWCLDCHRDPEPHLRPQEAITRMDWSPEGGEPGAALAREHAINPSTDCSICHR